MKLAFDVYPPKEDRSLPPVIMMHGRLDSRKTWKNFAPKIADETGRKVYALDTRNHGESPWSDEMTFETLADDLEEFLADHSIRKAILIGHSLGGRTAITLALRKPEKVEKIFIEDMDLQNYSAIAKTSVLQILNLLRKSLEVIPQGADDKAARQAVYDFIKSYLSVDTTKKGTIYDLDTIPLKKTGDGYVWKANLDVLERMLKHQTSQTFTGVYDGDAIFLYGNKSFFDVESDTSISKFFPGAKKVCVDGAGHLIHHDYPERFLDEVLNFLKI